MTEGLPGKDLRGSGGRRGWGGVLSAGVVEGLEVRKSLHRGGQAVLRASRSALARGLEQLYVTTQPGLKREAGGK